MRLFKWLLMALVVVGALFVLVINVFQESIGARLFERAVQANAGRSAIADLPDGLHAILIGSGSPLADPSRAGPSTAIIAGDNFFIIDSGGGAVRKMGLLQIPAGPIDAVFLTHFHSDHIDGLGELMLQRWVGAAHTSPLPIYGPSGIESIVDGLNLVYTADARHRTAHHGVHIAPPSGFGGVPMPFSGELPQIVYQSDDLSITAFEVDHHPVTEAVGYRFDYKGRSIVVSGDTKRTDTLTWASKGVDLLICEALNPEMVAKIGGQLETLELLNFARIMVDIPDYHITPVEAGKTAQEAGVEMLVFNHIVPAVPTKYLNPYFTKGVKDVYDGDYVVGSDGLMFSLLPNEDGILEQDLSR